MVLAFLRKVCKNMIEYFRYLKSDIYKLRHCAFFPVHLLFSLLGAGLMLTYAGISGSSNINKIAAFSQIYAIAYPFVISIVCQIVADQEMQAGYFQNLLTQTSRTKVIISKLTWLFCTGFTTVGISTVLFGVFFPLVTGTNLPAEFLLVISLVLWLSNLFLYGLHLFLAIRFGRNLSISVGAVGSLLSALMQTGLGTGLWYVIPYGWGIRFSESTTAWLLHLPTANQSELQVALLCSSVISCAIIIWCIIWFSRYNGTHTE